MTTFDCFVIFGPLIAFCLALAGLTACFGR